MLVSTGARYLALLTLATTATGHNKIQLPHRALDVGSSFGDSIEETEDPAGAESSFATTGGPGKENGVSQPELYDEIGTDSNFANSGPGAEKDLSGSEDVLGVESNFGDIAPDGENSLSEAEEEDTGAVSNFGEPEDDSPEEDVGAESNLGETEEAIPEEDLGGESDFGETEEDIQEEDVGAESDLGETEEAISEEDLGGESDFGETEEDIPKEDVGAESDSGETEEAIPEEDLGGESDFSETEEDIQEEDVGVGSAFGDSEEDILEKEDVGAESDFGETEEDGGAESNFGDNGPGKENSLDETEDTFPEGENKLDSEDDHGHDDDEDDHSHDDGEHGHSHDDLIWGAHIYPAMVSDTFGEASAMDVCDDFNGENGMLSSEEWFGDDNTLEIENNTLARNSSILWGWQYATYGAVDYDPEDPRVQASVTNFNPLAGEGILGVALSLGVGDSIDDAPALVLVSDADNDRVYAVCSYASGDGAWGNIIVSFEGDRNALGSSFLVEARMDPTTLDTNLTVTNIDNGPNAGKTIVFPCGAFESAAPLGTKAGIGIFGSDENLVVQVDDFAHSGCQKLDPEPECQPCSTRWVEDGVIMEATIGSDCTSVCVPTLLRPAVESAGGACGNCD